MREIGSQRVENRVCLKMQELQLLIRLATITLVVVITLILIIYESFAWLFVIFSIYVTSTLWGLQFIEYISGILLNLNIIKNKFIPRAKLKDSCNLCSNNSCKRHRLLPHSTRVKVPKDFNTALENLLEKLLETYVCTWYSNFSTNEAFLQQLRLAIATAAKNIAIRLIRADISAIIFDDLIPLALQHAQDWSAVLKKAKREGGDPQDFIASYLGCKIHPAAFSRQAELNYLRGLVTALMPHLLPVIHISTNNKVILREILANWILLPAIDALADPENINTLVTLSTHRDGALASSIDTLNVPMLQSWIALPLTPQLTHNCLKPTLDEVLNDPQLLYLFMQHIKESGPMNLLQFCLDIDDLSKRMLNPEMSPTVEECLYTDIQNMYAVYLDPDGPEYLHLPLHISTGLQQILEGGPDRIQELRTSRPFYQAHQEAHALLEATCLPSFHHSYQLYTVLCGQLKSDSKVKSSQVIASTTSSASWTSNRSSNPIVRIDGVLRPSTVDGSPFQLQDIYRAEEVDCSTRSFSEIKGLDKCHRDLTAWRVTVPHVDGGGTPPVYMIAVHSVAEAKSWTVLRQDQDFYTLRNRLAEFHGDKEMSDSPLPSRKNPHVSFTTNRQRYEDFLQKLLSKPMLRSSELLYTFLTTPNLKPCLTNYSTPDIGILYQSMTYKLRKEKGQHLDKFMSTFLASTNTKYEYMDIGVEPSADQSLNERHTKGRDLNFGVFGDNLSLHPSVRDFPYLMSRRDHIKGACFCIAEAVDSLLNVPRTISRFFWMFASLSRQRMDPVVNTLFYEMIVKLLSGGRAAIVVKLLHAKIMGSRTCMKDFSSQVKRHDYYESAKIGLHSLIPWWMVGFYKPWYRLMDSVLDPLQYAPFNKHLAYYLLDHLLINLFPEFTM